MKNYILPAMLLLTIAACNKKADTAGTNNNTNTLKGGKGGNYSIVAYSKMNDTGVKARIYIKYAADKAPADTSLYDEKGTAVPEPGYGAHVHFNNLAEGSYYIRAVYNGAGNDTVINISPILSTTEISVTLSLK